DARTQPACRLWNIAPRRLQRAHHRGSVNVGDCYAADLGQHVCPHRGEPFLRVLLVGPTGAVCGMKLLGAPLERLAVDSGEPDSGATGLADSDWVDPLPQQLPALVALLARVG